MKLTLHRSAPRPNRNGLLPLRRIFLQETLEVRLHGIRQRDRIAHVVDRPIEAEAHHAGEFGLAVRLGQQQHALAGALARVEGAERIAGCVAPRSGRRSSVTFCASWRPFMVPGMTTSVNSRSNAVPALTSSIASAALEAAITL